MKGQITLVLRDTSGYPLAAGGAQQTERRGERLKETEGEREGEIGPSVLTALNRNIVPLFVSQSRGVMDAL